MNFADFKTGPVMLCMALIVVAFVIGQSVFFIMKSNKRAKELGMDKSVIKQTIISSVLFTIAPAISILATVLALASALGLVLPWIRLSVIGNLAYETVAAEGALGALGSSLATEITDPQSFSTVAWAMTIGSCFPLILLPFLCKKLHKAMNKVLGGNYDKNKDGVIDEAEKADLESEFDFNNDGQLNVAENAVKEEAVKQANKEKKGGFGDILSAAAFIGIVTAFIGRCVAGTPKDAPAAGFMTISVLLSAIIFTIALDFICKKFNLKKLEAFVLPIAMFGAMGIAVLFTQVLPPDLVAFVWR